MTVPFGGASVLVTGGQGFVGAHLCERLLAAGARVVVPRRDVHPRSRFRREGIEERCELVACDLASVESVQRVLAEEEIEYVFHLAAQTIVGTARRAPLSTFESNVRATYVLLEACRSIPDRLRAIVVASSDKAYGPSDELPYKEDTPLRPTFPYDVSKACADLIARSYALTYELPVAVTRLANVYGPGDVNWSRIVPETCRALAEGRRPVLRSDGSPKRDFIYVDDAVEAYLAVARSLADRALHGRAWNAGSGEPTAVIEIVRELVAIAGVALEPEILGEGTPAGEIDAQWLDSSAIERELGWRPRVPLREGLRRSYDWYRRYLAALDSPHARSS
ncbi:NAD-dependent epimerase/dehydratase family protein [Thermoleophilum album]|uniref:NAD-dependent epimerase/dehydratase family protein n=1 Tax=Thermoleophilum album TaxID=29539 RepID=UPI00237C6464|nr:NAD-dependent epimerase/dehydratase family protein [Thermoleophilum album]